MAIRVSGLAALGVGLAAAVGCGRDPGRVGAHSDVTGKVVFADGKPVGDVVVTFAPQFTGGNQANAPTDAGGAFAVKLVPGKYAYLFEPKSGKADAYKAVPDKYRTTDAAHVVDAGGGPLTLTVTK